MATRFPFLSAPLSTSSLLTPGGRSPSTTPPSTPFISLNWSKGISLAYFPLASPLSVFLSLSRGRFVFFVRDEISLGLWRGKKTDRKIHDARREEMNRSFHRAAYDAGAFVTIRTGELTGDRYLCVRDPDAEIVRDWSISLHFGINLGKTRTHSDETFLIRGHFRVIFLH